MHLVDVRLVRLRLQLGEQQVDLGHEVDVADRLVRLLAQKVLEVLVVALAHQPEQLEHVEDERARGEVALEVGAHRDDRRRRQPLGDLVEVGAPLLLQAEEVGEVRWRR